MGVYDSPAVVKARAVTAKYREKIESGVGQVKTTLEITGGAYGAARLSAHLGGPQGKTVAGIPIELLIAGGAGLVGLSGHAGKYGEDLVAVGVGSAAAFAARAGFDAGMKTTKDVNKVSGAVGADALDQAMDALDAYAAQEE